MTDPLYLTVTQAAKALKVTRPRILRLLRDGRFPGAYKEPSTLHAAGFTWRIPARAVKDFRRITPAYYPRKSATNAQ